MPLRLSVIDESNRSDHSRLEPSDECYFLHEFTSGKGYSFSPSNNFVSNLKKHPRFRGTGSWHYKNRAIIDCARAFTDGLQPDWLRTGTLIPIPPSKRPDHPEYDDRMLQVCRLMDPGFPIDVRDIIEQQESLEPFHASPANRLSVADLRANYRVRDTSGRAAPTSILVVDDVLTAGTHFKAVQGVLAEAYPDAAIAGLFVARRVFADPFGAMDD